MGVLLSSGVAGRSDCVAIPALIKCLLKASTKFCFHIISPWSVMKTSGIVGGGTSPEEDLTYFLNVLGLRLSFIKFR